MKNYKLSMILCSIGIILVSLLMIVSSYAYFTIKINGEGNDIEVSTFDKNTNIVFTDTSNVSLVNAYTGDEIIKTFSIENTSDLSLYYDIVLKNVVNNFESKNDLVFILECEDKSGAFREQSILPSSDTNIASNILIGPNKNHNYKMTIKFLDTNYDQSDNMNKTFSSNIMISGSKINVGQTIYDKGSLLEKIITLSDIETNNIYKTNNSTNGTTIYYYKGNSETNNNVIYNNMCFKIIRTDENYGIKLLYNGELEEGVCNPKKTVLDSVYNEKSNYNAYVGYMYGKASSNNYKNEHNNANASQIKLELDKWYKESILNNALIDKNAVYCNYRETNSFRLNGVLYAKNGYGANNSGYYIYDNKYPSLDCYSLNDRFSVANENSNKNLEYPVGLISVDELLYLGLDFTTNNNDSYLASSDNYWTMTAAYFNGSDAYNYSVINNKISPNNVSKSLGIRPVITINKSAQIVSGDGSEESPFTIK